MVITTQQAAKESGGVSFHYPMLTSSNYDTWAIKMEAIMDAQGVWESIELVTGTTVDPKKDKMAWVYLF